MNKPLPPIIKVNTHGSTLENPGKIGACDILRDHKCDLIYVDRGTSSIRQTNAVQIKLMC